MIGEFSREHSADTRAKQGGIDIPYPPCLNCTVMELFPIGKDAYIAIAVRWGMVIGLAGVLVAFMVSMPGRSYTGPLKPLSNEETAIRDNLKNHVSMIAGTIGQRNAFSFNGLYACADYIR